MIVTMVTYTHPFDPREGRRVACTAIQYLSITGDRLVATLAGVHSKKAMVDWVKRCRS